MPRHVHTRNRVFPHTIIVVRCLAEPLLVHNQAVKSQLQAIVLGCQNNEELSWSVARDSGFMHNVHPNLLEPDNKLLLVVLYEV